MADMPSQTARKPRRTPSVKDMVKARRMFEMGDTYAEIGRCLDLTPETVAKRAKREGWERGSGESGGDAEARMPVTSKNRSADQTSSDFPENPQSDDNCNLIALPQDLRDALTAAANADPAEIQQAFGRVAQVIVSRGITTIQMPRTVAELKTWFEIFRKAHGLDQPAPKDAGAGGLLGPLRTVSRRVVPVEAVESGPAAEVDPDEGVDMDEVLGLK